MSAAHARITLCVAWAVAFTLLGVACTRKESPPRVSASEPTTASTAQQTEAAASARSDTPAQCPGRVTLYDGSIAVNAQDHVHLVPRAADYVEEDIAELDRVLSTAGQLRFTLDYPFEEPFEGTVTGRITLRTIIDAVRAGFRRMYEGTTQRDIPGMENKDVNGSYGRAFHVIGDLVIESIELCEGNGRLEIGIGS
jgi:hypothetical protein